MSIVFFGLVILTGCFGKKPVKTGLEGQPMPSFDLLFLDSVTRINTNSIPKGQPIVFLFISPVCPYCKAQTQEILSDIKSFAGIKLYIITSLAFQAFKQYSVEYKLNKYSSITLGHDFSNYFAGFFKVTGVPYIAIFNKDKILKSVFSGKITTNLIRDAAFQWNKIGNRLERHKRKSEILTEVDNAL